MSKSRDTLSPNFLMKSPLSPSTLEAKRKERALRFGIVEKTEEPKVMPKKALPNGLISVSVFKED
jgi:hypothetical protein